MKPSEALTELLDARDRLKWEESKSTPSKSEVRFCEEEVERLKAQFDETVWVEGHK